MRKLKPKAFYVENKNLMSGNRKPTNIGKFNQVVGQLFDICLEYYPEPKTIQYYQYQLELGQTANPRLIVEKIMESLTPFIGHFMTRDENFFLHCDLNQVVHDSQGVNVLDSIRSVWEHLPDQTVKDKVWKLVQLSLMYGVMVTKDPQQLAIINSYRATPLEV